MNEQRTYWMTSSVMTVLVDVQAQKWTNGAVTWRIVRAPPIVKRFIGQDVHNLMDWMRKQPGFYWEIR